MHRAFALASAIVVAAALAWGLALAGGPSTRRDEQLDDRRLSDLRAIVAELRADYVARDGTPRLKEPLPTTLAALSAVARSRLSVRDPSSGDPYAYAVKDPRHVELCATFDRARDEATDVFWNHSAGRVCFVVDVLGDR